MAEGKLTRLNKVLREFNISLDRAVEFLSSNGHEIEARPTTKISQEQYNILLEEFRSDKTNKVESHDLSEEKRKEKEELRIKIEKELEEKQKAKKAIVEAKVELTKPKQVGTIDLDSLKKSNDIKEKNKSKVEDQDSNDKLKTTIKDIDATQTKIETQYKKLTGLKTVGNKIDLDKIEKPNVSEESKTPTTKRKRIRISKDVAKFKKDTKR